MTGDAVEERRAAEREYAYHCAHCGKEITIQIQRCKGCQCFFCKDCLEIHIQDNWRFIGHLYPDRKSEEAR